MFLIIIIIAIKITSSFGANCTEALVSPCKCKSVNEIECADWYDSNNEWHFIANSDALRTMFENISMNTSCEDKHFQAISFSGSRGNLSELPADSFLDITFTSIVIDSLVALRNISSNAFRLSNPYLLQFEIRNTLVNSADNDDYDLFKALKSMPYLQRVALVNTNLGEIPDNAFQTQLRTQTALRSIEISGNSNLISIGSEAFNDLKNLTLIKLSGNKLEEIGSNSFQITSFRSINLTLDLSVNRIESIDDNAFITSNIALNINLSKNNLNTSSFSPNAFTSISRPSTIILSDNPSIKSLLQHHLELALSVGHHFILDRNVLTCNCSIYWLLLNRKQYKKQVLCAFCDDGFELFQDDRIDYLNC